MRARNIVVYPLATVSLYLACSAESRPFDSIIRSFDILSEQSPLRSYLMGKPEGQVSTGVIISDVIGKTQNIAIFSSLTRDVDAVSGRLDDAAQNTTVLAPDNTFMRGLKRKPWEDPEDYNSFGANAYEGSSGEDRARKNLERFVQRHIVTESPWEEGKKVKTLYGNEVWWESKDGQKKVSLNDSSFVGSLCLLWDPHCAHRKQISFTPAYRIRNYIACIWSNLHQATNQMVRWPRFVVSNSRYLTL
ncbi:hypothetical protein IAQ61_004465 [Plenodomus lingam]|uniref:uncharacterized protein n=1 Tax=Leptosphaeria maculans TaxID=5022 RepID=UPI00332705A0|nr:hypothetical protein IAQ61_004465 [Plenodomus lingam]